MELFDKNTAPLSFSEIKSLSNSKDNDKNLLIFKMNWNQIHLINKHDNTQYNKNQEYYKLLDEISTKLLYFINRFVNTSRIIMKDNNMILLTQLNKIPSQLFYLLKLRNIFNICALKPLNLLIASNRMIRQELQLQPPKTET